MHSADEPGNGQAGGGRVSIVIPAHNESGVLPCCLKQLLQQDYGGRMQVILVANGCTDNTAAVARSHEHAFASQGHELVVVELLSAGKPAALNAGDALARRGIRIYLDADVRLSANAVREVAAHLADGTGTHLCSPRLTVAPSRSWITRCYARVWSHLPYIRDDIIGCGFYAVSTAGRQRWHRFPDIISDDKFVRLHFADHERKVADRAQFIIQMPEGLKELLRVRGRWCRGNLELRRHFPWLDRRDRGRYRSLAPFLLRSPQLWGHLALFVPVYLLSKGVAIQRTGIGTAQWERAEQARTLLKGSGPAVRESGSLA